MDPCCLPGRRPPPSLPPNSHQRGFSMRLRFALLAAALLSAAPILAAEVEKPAALVADGIPPVPAELADATRPYMEFRTASFQGWNPRTRGIAITTRFGNVAQVH